MKTKVIASFFLLLVSGYSAVASTEPKYQAEFDSGVKCADKGDWKAAKKHFQKAVNYAPDRGGGWLRLARCCEKINDREGASEAYRKCTTGEHATPGRLLSYSLFLLRAGQKVQAQEALQKAFEKRKQWNAWGDISFLKNELPELRTICSGNADRLTQLGEALMKANDYATAESCFREAISVKPGFLDARSRLAIALFHQGKRDKAEKTAEGILTKHPDNAETLFLMAFIRGVQKRRAESIKFYKRYLALQPHNVLAWNNLGVTETEAGLLKDADVSLARAIKEDPKHYISWWSLAELRKKTGNDEEAASLARKALTFAPENNARTLFALGDFLESAHDIEGARQARAKGLKADPEGAEAVMYVPYFLETEGAASKAVEADK